MKPPKTPPKGFGPRKIEAIAVRSRGWRRSDSLICNVCDKPAYFHPYTDSIAGCKHCNFKNRSPSVYFRKAIFSAIAKKK